MDILQVRNLTKKFGSFTAVDNISFSLRVGEILGLLGPNGAGKTTTIHMLLGLTTQNSGGILYFNKNFETNRQECLQRINYTSSFNMLQGRVSVWENLLVFSYLYGMKNPRKKILELMDYFEVTEILNKRFYDLSSGQKTRINLIKSLLNDPEILLMDEPTASLDPDIADKTLSFIEDLKKKRNITILYTSHNMDEVTRICDKVVFIDRGKIIAHDTPLGLTKLIKKSQLRIVFDENKSAVENFLKEEKQQFNFIDVHTVEIKTEERLIPKIIFGISNKEVWITDIEIKKPTLEDVFLQFTRNKNHVIVKD